MMERVSKFTLSEPSPSGVRLMDEHRKGMNNALIVTRIPKFLRSLYEILYAEDTAIITWSLDGRFFEIFDIKRLEAEILPKYYKHCKFASFQRQLNNFGFRKWTKTQSNVCTFSHRFYVQQHPDDLMELIMKNAEFLAAKGQRRENIPATASSNMCLRPNSGLHRRKRRSLSNPIEGDETIRMTNTTAASLLFRKDLPYRSKAYGTKISHRESNNLPTENHGGTCNEAWNLHPLEVMKTGSSKMDPIGHDSPTTISDGTEFIDLYPPELLNDILQSAADFMEDHKTPRNTSNGCYHQHNVHSDMITAPTACAAAFPHAWNHEPVYRSANFKARTSPFYPRSDIQLWSA